MATLVALRRRALQRYGILGSGAEDRKWTNPVMADAINEAHRWLAKESRLYWDERQANVVAGTSSIALGTDVFEVENDTLRIQNSGTWQPLRFVALKELQQRCGPLDEVAAADPWAYYLRTGDTSGAHVILKLFPKPQTSVSAGLRYACFIAPPDLEDDDDEPAMQAAWQDYLLPVTCWKMAELEMAQGRPDAPIGYWLPRAEKAAEELKSLVTRLRNPGPRRVRGDQYDAYDW
jgi:hypothetical protein